MKYLLIVFLAVIAGVEFFHELSSAEPSAAALCRASDTTASDVADSFLQHLHSHR